MPPESPPAASAPALHVGRAGQVDLVSSSEDAEKIACRGGEHGRPPAAVASPWRGPLGNLFRCKCMALHTFRIASGHVGGHMLLRSLAFTF